MQVGSKNWNIKHLKLDEVEKIYSLGTWFYKDPDETNKHNYNEKFKQFEGILQYWKNHHLNTLEKIKTITGCPAQFNVRFTIKEYFYLR